MTCSGPLRRWHHQHHLQRAEARSAIGSLARQTFSPMPSPLLCSWTASCGVRIFGGIRSLQERRWRL